MRLIVISDTHGSIRAIESVFLRNSDADWFIHLGDGERELDDFLNSHPEYIPKVMHVSGNCDYNSLSNDFEVLNLYEHKIFVTHGHRYGVKSSLERLKDAALDKGCDIILYGHTHVSYNNFEDGLYILNPGSAAAPRDGAPATFGTINILPLGVIMNVANV